MGDLEVQRARRTLLQHGESLPPSEEQWRLVDITLRLMRDTREFYSIAYSENERNRWYPDDKDDNTDEAIKNKIKNIIRWAKFILEECK